MASILLVEDDAQLSEQIKAWLSYDAHEVEIAATAAAGLDQLAARQFDIIVLDWVLPDVTGLDLCRTFRQQGGQTPILMLSGKQASDEKALALDSGADDYLGKPAHPKELSARVGALLRRSANLQPQKISVGELELDVAANRVFTNGKELLMPPREFLLLKLFMQNPNHAFTPDEILEKLWSSESDVSTSVVKVHINRLRKRLADYEGTFHLRTARGAGYLLSTSVHEK